MVNENPVQRPSATTLLHHPSLCPDANKSKAQLRKELNREKFKNEMLQRQVKLYEEQISKLDSPTNEFIVPPQNHNRITTLVTTSTTMHQKSSGLMKQQFVRSLSSTFI